MIHVVERDLLTRDMFVWGRPFCSLSAKADIIIVLGGINGSIYTFFLFFCHFKLILILILTELLLIVWYRYGVRVQEIVAVSELLIIEKRKDCFVLLSLSSDIDIVMRLSTGLDLRRS